MTKSEPALGFVPKTLMQGPFNQQTDKSGFYTSLLGTEQAPIFGGVAVILSAVGCMAS